MPAVVEEFEALAAGPLSAGNPPFPGCVSSSDGVRLVPVRKAYGSLHPSASGLSLTERQRGEEYSFAYPSVLRGVPCCWMA